VLGFAKKLSASKQSLIWLLGSPVLIVSCNNMTCHPRSGDFKMMIKSIVKLLKRTTLATVLSLALATSAQSQTSSVAIGQGSLAGKSENGITSFLGIPYAAPPIGALRFRPPAAPPRWTNRRDAIAYGPSCPQPQRNDIGAGRGAGTQSEDCLTLNVWSRNISGKAPVMVWIHGGGHRVGSGSVSLYNGSELARQDVVVVTINYRLGLLGYFAHPALTAEVGPNVPLGNYGLMDQIAALQWVRDNIAKFGGDPTNVTVFGESAGGASTLYLLATPSAKGLFSKAIVQSGGGLQSPKNLAETEADGQATGRSLGLSTSATAADLRALAVSTLVNGQPLEGLGFGPFVDGRLVVETPAQAFSASRAHDVPLLIGANSNEASVMATLNVTDRAITSFLGSREAEIKAAYGGAAISDAEFTRQIFGDATFVGPARWIAGQAASGAPSFLYHFNYVLERRRDSQPGAGHGSEIPHIFRSWNQIPFADRLLTERDKQMTALLSSCWVSFAKTGTPSCDSLPVWQPYSPATDTLMEFAPVSGPRAAFRKTQLDAVLGVQAPARN
jgi:para-nitrobenzyl esterase